MSSLPEHLDGTAARAPLPAPAPTPVADEPRPHLRAVPPRRRRQPRVGLWLAGIATAATLFLLVAFNVFMVQGQFDLEEIAEQRALEQKQYERLRARVAALASPDSVIERARAQGMVDGMSPTYISAPPAAPSGPDRDRTAVTQQDSYDDTKAALDPGP
jgi:hypothetical protein